MSISFELSKPLAEYGRALREWSATECRPYAREADDRHARPVNWREILDTAPVPLGRVDIPDAEPIPTFDEGKWVTKLVIYENINYGDTWVHPTLGGGIGHLVVKSMGTPEQLDKWYTPVVEKGLETGFALTEPHFGSDTTQVATTAVRDGDNWILNGSKIFCTSGATAEYITVFATTDKSLGAKGIACFVVPKDTPGFAVARANESKLGIRTWITSALAFEDCVIPLENRLGWDAGGPVDDPTRASGHSGALGALSENRPNIAAMAIGLAQASLDLTTSLLQDRRDGFTAQRWSAIEAELARMNSALDRGRRINFKAQFLVDRGTPSRTFPAMSKAFSPQTADRIIRRCMQLLGPEGTAKELLLEKWYRDVKIMDIFEGSAQVQRLIVARSLMGRTAG